MYMTTNLNMKYQIGKGITLREHLQDCRDDKQSSEWMIFDSMHYSLDMKVYPVFLDDWDLEPEEYEEIEDNVLSENKGYGNLLNTDQLNDIISNLAMQKEDYAESELEAAINYYNKNDAFIDM